MQRVIAITAATLAAIILPVAVAIAANVAPSSNTPESTPQDGGIDVAVTEIVPDLPAGQLPAVTEGDKVTINVTVENNGTEAVTFTLTLTDDTDNKEIGTRTETLEASTSDTFGFNWNTTGASYEDDQPPPDARPHSLTATAILDTDTNPDNNAFTTGTMPGHGVMIRKNPPNPERLLPRRNLRQYPHPCLRPNLRQYQHPNPRRHPRRLLLPHLRRHLRLRLRPNPRPSLWRLPSLTLFHSLKLLSAKACPWQIHQFKPRPSL